MLKARTEESGVCVARTVDWWGGWRTGLNISSYPPWIDRR